jgi:iron-sulfur cluster assembly protein
MMNETTQPNSAPAGASSGPPSVNPPSRTTERGTPSEQPPASKRLAISITQGAVDAIHSQIVKRNMPGTALRVGIRGGGCSGFSYVIEFHDGEPRARDIVYDLKASDGSDVRVVVDKKSILYLNGATLDWERTLMRQGFKFLNPNEQASCGCGTSFTV